MAIVPGMQRCGSCATGPRHRARYLQYNASHLASLASLYALTPSTQRSTHMLNEKRDIDAAFWAVQVDCSPRDDVSGFLLHKPRYMHWFWQIVRVVFQNVIAQSSRSRGHRCLGSCQQRVDVAVAALPALPLSFRATAPEKPLCALIFPVCRACPVCLPSAR